MVSKDKADAAQRMQKKIANEDPDSTVKFSLQSFPINSLLNNDSFITLYPDVLDIVFYNPEIVNVLKHFETSSGFVVNINSMKQVALDGFLKSAVLGKSPKSDGKDEFENIRAFLGKYVETQLFNGLLKNTVDEDDTGAATLDPQEYFDEVASACSEAISKKIVAENVKPNLFASQVSYSIFPISESIARNDMLKNVGIVITMAGNIGVEKTSGSFLKKGKIFVLLDITLKVVVFNNYIYSKRGLTLILNGIREREKRERSALMDEHIDRQTNVVEQEHQIRYDTKNKPNGLKGRLIEMADNALSEKAHTALSTTVTSVTHGYNQKIGALIVEPNKLE
ncbi:coiled-coil domain-containing protein [Acrasis kona]|uniref:Coiled-coil domain-containing protein n=1 Tax=Acrasis kona TaxID=1008807 RepID=A0AAW2YWA0_9EUKA